MTTDWFDRAFGPWYAKLYPHRDITEAAKAVESVTPLLEGSEPILDLACGSGRHVSVLRGRGVSVWGADRSSHLLAAGNRRDELRGRLVRADMRRLPFVSGTFGGVLLMFTSFGYFESRSAHVALLQEIARVSRDGGFLALDYLNAASVRQTLVPRSEREVDGHRVLETRFIAEREGEPRVIKELLILDHTGEPLARYEEVVALYEPEDVAAMLARAGWRETQRYGDYDRSPWSSESQRCFMVAIRSAT